MTQKEYEKGNTHTHRTTHREQKNVQRIFFTDGMARWYSYILCWVVMACARFILYRISAQLSSIPARLIFAWTIFVHSFCLSVSRLFHTIHVIVCVFGMEIYYTSYIRSLDGAKETRQQCNKVKSSQMQNNFSNHGFVFFKRSLRTKNPPFPS